jgi:alginate O-acetyltransferase complex protein AlgI
MLFNSYEFLFGFLPACLAGYYVVRRGCGRDLALAFLTAASFVFYLRTGLFDLVLLGISIVVNFSIAFVLADLRSSVHRRAFLAAGVVLNLLS